MLVAVLSLEAAVVLVPIFTPFMASFDVLQCLHIGAYCDDDYTYRNCHSVAV